MHANAESFGVQSFIVPPRPPHASDTDAGVDGAAPAACQWDAGSDPVAQLSVVLEARRAALARLARQSGRGSAAHVTQAYLWHRYQAACAAKVIGGLTFAYDGARATPGLGSAPGDGTSASLILGNT